MADELNTLDEQSPVEVEETEATEPVEETEAEPAEQAGDEAEESDEGEGADDETKPKKKGGFQRKIERLERERFEAIRRAEELERWAMQQMQRQQPPPGPAAAGEPMPRLADVNFDEEAHAAAVAQWHQRQISQVQQQQQEWIRQQSLAHSQQQAMAALNQKVMAATAKYPDFVQKVQNPELPNLGAVNPTAFDAVVESPAFADVAMFLANNPSEIYAFHGMTPIQAQRRVLELEQRLTKRPQAKANPPPAPPAKLGASGSSAQKDPSKMTMAEYAKWSMDRRAKLNR